jgi:raffinose/stachyose/melibiose transport system substrate-binding protein
MNASERDAMRRSRTGRRGAVAGVVVVFSLLVLGVAGGAARPAAPNVTLTVLTTVTNHPAFDVLLPNFGRVHPNISLNVTYAPSLGALYQLETTELAAGNAPDLFAAWPGCGTPISVCQLAKAGHMTKMVNKSWATRDHPLVTSYSKYGKNLYMFSPVLTFDGLWTNDTLFNKLGLKVPQTFPQLLDTCAKAKAAGTIPLLLTAQGSGVVQQLLADIALTTVYAKDPKWAQKLRAGKVTFAGSPGWHHALQELVDMKNAGCFEPGPAGVTSASGDAMFGQGRALMYVCLTSHKGPIDAVHPQIAYSQHPFPAPVGTAPNKTMVLLNLGQGFAVNAHASRQHQQAAQTFIDFFARPKQDALYAQVNGGITPYQFKTASLPAYLASFSARFRNHKYAINPVETWWNADVGDALTTYGTGLITGQSTIDDVLKAMDVAWQQGPS